MTKTEARKIAKRKLQGGYFHPLYSQQAWVYCSDKKRHKVIVTLNWDSTTPSKVSNQLVEALVEHFTTEGECE